MATATLQVRIDADLKQEAETALKIVLKGVMDNKNVQAPDDEKVYAVLRGTNKTKERAANGKKPVRRGES